MAPFARDTTPTADAVYLARLQAMPGWQKLAQAMALNAMRDRLAMVGIRRRYPHASHREVQRRLFDLKLGPARAAMVYGPLDQWVEEAEWIP